MIHLLMLSFGWIVALLLRWQWHQRVPKTWNDRWSRALLTFVLPPVLLLTTAIALLWMGPMGQMVHGWQGWLTYDWAIGFLALMVILGLQLLGEGLRSVSQLRQYETKQIHTQTARLIPLDLPFVAQIGFWQPQLMISQGLLDRLDDQHLNAVLVHEAAHQHYRDTFWFFGLGWLRRCSIWLPNTEALWQELLLLREMRADRWAAEKVDPLLLAEALLIVVSTPMQMECVAALNGDMVIDRIEERIDALLEPYENISTISWKSILASLLVFLPLLAIPFHR